VRLGVSSYEEWLDIQAQDYGEFVMTNDGRCDVTRPRKPPQRRCAFLLGSAAAFAIALAAGTGGFGRPATTFAAPAHAASDQFRGPASFAPIVDRVRPAVVSVRDTGENEVRTIGPERVIVVRPQHERNRVT
jgi:anti-sigma factor RsiW